MSATGATLRSTAMKKPPVSPWCGSTRMHRSSGIASLAESGNMVASNFKAPACGCATARFCVRGGGAADGSVLIVLARRAAQLPSGWHLECMLGGSSASAHVRSFVSTQSTSGQGRRQYRTSEPEAGNTLGPERPYDVGLTAGHIYEAL